MEKSYPEKVEALQAQCCSVCQCGTHDPLVKRFGFVPSVFEKRRIQKSKAKQEELKNVYHKKCNIG